MEMNCSATHPVRTPANTHSTKRARAETRFRYFLQRKKGA